MLVMVKASIVMDGKTRDLLRDLGKKGESYEDIILRMIRAENECQKRNKQRREEGGHDF